MKIRVLLQTGIFLTCWRTVGLSRTIFHGFSKIASYFVLLNSDLNFSTLTSACMGEDTNICIVLYCEILLLMTVTVFIYLGLYISRQAQSVFFKPNRHTLFPRFPRRWVFTIWRSRLLHSVSTLSDERVSFLGVWSGCIKDAPTLLALPQFLVNVLHGWLHPHFNRWPVSLGRNFPTRWWYPCASIYGVTSKKAAIWRSA